METDLLIFPVFSHLFQCKRNFDIKTNCSLCSRICISDLTLELKLNHYFHNIHPKKFSSLSISYMFEECKE